MRSQRSLISSLYAWCSARNRRSRNCESDNSTVHTTHGNNASKHKPQRQQTARPNARNETKVLSGEGEQKRGRMRLQSGRVRVSRWIASTEQQATPTKPHQRQDQPEISQSERLETRGGNWGTMSKPQTSRNLANKIE